MAVTVDDALAYVGIEAEWADAQMTLSMTWTVNAAKAWLKGAVGGDVDMDDPLAVELCLMAIGELWETRGLTDHRTTQKTYSTLNRMCADLLMQLRYPEPEDEEEEEDGE